MCFTSMRPMGCHPYWFRISHRIHQRHSDKWRTEYIQPKLDSAFRPNNAWSSAPREITGTRIPRLFRDRSPIRLVVLGGEKLTRQVDL